MTTGPSPGHACRVCASVYADESEAERCGLFPEPPEALRPGTLVEAKDAAPETGAGYLTKSFLIGLDDPRGPAHTRFYRVNFLWGRADFLAEQLVDRGAATEDEWRQAVVDGHFGPDR